MGVLAAGLDLIELMQADLDLHAMQALTIGLVVSAISAYLVIGWLLHWLRRRTMDLFVIYRIALGIIIFALA